jgi:hypothetical protein
LNSDSSSPAPLNGTSTLVTRATALPLTRAQLVALALTAIVMVAVTFRTSALSSSGLSDDEVTKVRAAEAYSRGDFGVNTEHPMLMKLAIWGSISAADTWNQIAPSRYRVSVEAAVRLPNAVIGAATPLVMYGVAHAYFGTPAALVAALLLALDPNVMSINRLAKEDTFVVFFFLLAVWLYERGKQVGTTDVVRAQRWYLGSATAFGWMVASKYLPHLYGLYALFNVATQRDAGANRPVKRRFFATMAVAFIAANVVILLPSTWRHMLGYAQGAGLAHHGWPYAHQLWVTDVPISPLGVPPTFYAMFLLTRVQLVTLAGATVGAIVAAYRRRERGYVFLRVMLCFQILGYSVMAAKFLRYSLPILVLVDLLAAVGIATMVGWLAKQVKSETRAFLVPVAYGALALVLFAGQVQASPFFSMHRNPLARWLDADGRRFPEASYDFGIREAVAQIAASAAPGAEIVSDVPQVVEFNLARSPRNDIQVKSFSGSTLYDTATEQWVLAQDAHVYFETEQLIALLRLRHRPVAEYRIGDVPVLQVFRIPGRAGPT